LKRLALPHRGTEEFIMTSLKKLVALGALPLACLLSAKADIITVNTVGSPTTVGGITTWTYSALLTDTEQLNSKQDFGTVYDFNVGSLTPTVTSTGLLSTDFSFEEVPTSTGLTEADGQARTIGSCPTCYDIRFTYNGAAVIGGTTPTPLGTFSIETNLTGMGSSYYDGEAFNVSSQAMNGNSGVVAVPAAATPEPGSLMLLGTGLFGGAATMLRRRRSVSL
jgi:hypothetical protein